MSARHSIVLVFLLPLIAVGAEPAPDALKAFRTAYPLSTAVWATGDLDGDGHIDAAALTNTEGMQRIVALLARADETYSVFSSNAFPWHQRRIDSVEIKNGLLVYHYDTSGGAYYSTDFKFKFNEGAFYLVGFESITSGTTYVKETDQAYKSGTSANYLTHQVIYWRTSGKRRVEVTRTIGDRAPIQLNVFFGPNGETPKERLRGYIDEHFRFINDI